MQTPGMQGTVTPEVRYLLQPCPVSWQTGALSVLSQQPRSCLCNTLGLLLPCCCPAAAGHKGGQVMLLCSSNREHSQLSANIGSTPGEDPHLGRTELRPCPSLLLPTGTNDSSQAAVRLTRSTHLVHPHHFCKSAPPPDPTSLKCWLQNLARFLKHSQHGSLATNQSARFNTSSHRFRILLSGAV